MDGQVLELISGGFFLLLLIFDMWLGWRLYRLSCIEIFDVCYKSVFLMVLGNNI